LVNFSCSSNRTHVIANSGGIVFVAIDFFEDQSTVIQQQRLNICLAIDCSGSMYGEKIEQAKQSALTLAKGLYPNDLISIVSFEARVKVELSPTPASEQEKIEKVIQSIRLGSATFLYSALKQAHKVVSKNLQSSISRIVLLTDGIPTDNDNIQDYVDRCREIKKDGITVSPIGIGAEYNEELLMQIGDAGGGAWEHVTNPHEQLKDFLRDQVKDMRDTVLVSPELIVDLIPGAEILDYYSVKPVLTKMELPERNGNQYPILLRDIIKGQSQTIVFRIKLPSQQTGDYNLLKASIMGNTMDLPISYTDDSSLYNIETDANPRILLETATGVTMIGKGMGEDTVVMEQGRALLDKIKKEVEGQTVVLDKDATVLLSGAKDIETRLMSNPTGEQIKDLKHGITVIGAKQKKG